MKINVEKFLMKKGNRVAKAAIEFNDANDGILRGFHFIGFTICDDPEKGLFVLFPSSIIKHKEEGATNRPYFFLRPTAPDLLDKLQDAILDVYDSMMGFNRPKLVDKTSVKTETETVK